MRDRERDLGVDLRLHDLPVRLALDLLVQAVAPVHADQLCAAGDDGGQGGQDAEDVGVVRGPRYVDEIGLEVAEDGHRERRREAVQGVEAVGEREEGDWEVDEGWMDGMTVVHGLVAILWE